MSRRKHLVERVVLLKRADNDHLRILHVCKLSLQMKYHLQMNVGLCIREPEKKQGLSTNYIRYKLGLTLD